MKSSKTQTQLVENGNPVENVKMERQGQQFLTSICGPEAFTKASSGLPPGESLVLALVARRQSTAGQTNNDSGDELERKINHGVTPQQDGLRKLLSPARSTTNVTDQTAANKQAA